mgnify:FL=1
MLRGWRVRNQNPQPTRVCSRVKPQQRGAFFAGTWRAELHRVNRSLRRACTALPSLVALLLAGCAQSPEIDDYPPYQDRALTQSTQGVEVTVSVLTGEESKAVYGIDLEDVLIQPVWVQVRNESTRPYWFMMTGLDPNYFAPSEAAYAFLPSTSDLAALSAKIDSLSFKNPIRPGGTASGFVLTNLDEGVKAVDVDLIGRGDAKIFTFVAVDPTFNPERPRVELSTLYEDREILEPKNETELRRLLESLPCCTTNEAGDEFGDPLNLVLVGSRADILAALVRRQWHPTEVLNVDTIWRTVESFIAGERYRYAPISPLYLYGRQQDGAAQKARSTVNERNHARFWLSPIRFRGQDVWIGQISRDIGIKFTLKSPTISTHVIDPDIDEARRYFVEDMAYSQALDTLAYIMGSGAVQRDEPNFNLVGDPYFTDGLRAVLFFSPRPHSLSDIDFLNWERPPSVRQNTEKTGPGFKSGSDDASE